MRDFLGITAGAVVVGWLVEISVTGWPGVGWGPLLGGLASLGYIIVHAGINSDGKRDPMGNDDVQKEGRQRKPLLEMIYTDVKEAYGDDFSNLGKLIGLLIFVLVGAIIVVTIRFVVFLFGLMD